MCGDQKSTLSVVPWELFTFVFEIWSLNGLEYTKQASLTDQQVQRSACITSLVLGLQVGPTTPGHFTDWTIAPALIYFILYILIHLYISAKLNLNLDPAKFKLRICISV